MIRKPHALLLSIAAALLAAVALAGCHQVTVVSFAVKGDGPQTPVDSLIVDIMATPSKQSKTLGGVHETLGLYDLRGDVTITASACAGDLVVLRGVRTATVPIDRIVVELQPQPGTEACPVSIDGSVVYQHGGAGGSA